MGNGIVKTITITETKAILTIIGILAVCIGGFLYGLECLGALKDTQHSIINKVEELEDNTEIHNEFDKRIDLNKQRSDNNYKDLQKDINNLDRKMDKVIETLKEINQGAVLITKPLSEDSKKNNLE